MTGKILTQAGGAHDNGKRLVALRLIWGKQEVVETELSQPILRLDWPDWQLLYRRKHVSLIRHAKCQAGAFAAFMQAGDSGDIPQQTARLDACAEAASAIRFSSARGVLACAVAAIHFAHEGHAVVVVIDRRQAVKQHIVLGELINRRGQNAKAEIAVNIEFLAKMFARQCSRKEVGLIDADAARLVGVGHLCAKAEAERGCAFAFVA